MTSEQLCVVEMDVGQPRQKRRRTPRNKGSGSEPPNDSHQSTVLREVDDETKENERLLNEFIRKHPMLSLEALNSDGMTLLVEMNAKLGRPISLRSLPAVPKSYEDTYLRPPNTKIGERACACGDTCYCKFLATLRYGRESPYEFIGVEFLLPEERHAWQNGKNLPEQPGKCLICLRYWTTWCYIRARQDPTWCGGEGVYAPQRYTNVYAPQKSQDSEPPVRYDLDELPKHTNLVDVEDGYRRSAMLFADETFTESRAVRTESPTIGQIMWRPVVRFRSDNYKYILDGESNPYIVQCNVGLTDQHLNGGASHTQAEGATQDGKQSTR